MEYLKKYNLTDEDIEEIKEFIDDMDYKELVFNSECVEILLNYFIGIGITNIKDILMYKTNLFYDDVDSIKNVFKNIDLNTIKQINEDVMNLSLLGF